MSKRARIPLFAAGIPLVLLIALWSLGGIVTGLLEREAVKGRLLRLAADALRGHVACESVRVDFLPRPGLTLERLVLDLPGRLTARVDAVFLRPSLSHVLQDDDLARELARIHDVEGQGSGTIVCRRLRKHEAGASRSGTMAFAWRGSNTGWGLPGFRRCRGS